MGYDVHITRADDWPESSQNPIRLEEWLEYLKSDPEFRLDGKAEAITPQGERIRCESEGLAVWIAHPKHGQRGNMAWFDCQDGEVVVKNPDDPILGKMRVVAKALHARVQGDDGEYYDEELKAPSPAKQAVPNPPRPWWKRLMGG